MSLATEKKALFDNAIAMAVTSLKPVLGNDAPVNFTNGRNVTPKNEQDSRLLVVAAIEGYKSNMWATPRQINELGVGAVISPDAARVPVFMTKTSKKGNEYLTSYDVVNLDCVSWPNGMPSECITRILELARNPKKADAPTFPAPTPIPSRRVPAQTISVEPEPKTPKRVRTSGVLSMSEKQTVGRERKPNVVVEFEEFGIRIEARTVSEAQLMLDSAVAAYVTMGKTYVAMKSRQ